MLTTSPLPMAPRDLPLLALPAPEDETIGPDSRVDSRAEGRPSDGAPVLALGGRPRGRGPS